MLHDINWYCYYSSPHFICACILTAPFTITTLSMHLHAHSNTLTNTKLYLRRNTHSNIPTSLVRVDLVSVFHNDLSSVCHARPCSSVHMSPYHWHLFTLYTTPSKAWSTRSLIHFTTARYISFLWTCHLFEPPDATNLFYYRLSTIKFVVHIYT